MKRPEAGDFHPYYRGGHAMNLQYEPNAVAGSAMIEENEKERALELYKVQREQELQEEYKLRISEMTSDYKSKLRELDSTYSEKKTELERERQSIMQAGSES